MVPPREGGFLNHLPQAEIASGIDWNELKRVLDDERTRGNVVAEAIKTLYDVLIMLS